MLLSNNIGVGLDDLWRSLPTELFYSVELVFLFNFALGTDFRPKIASVHRVSSTLQSLLCVCSSSNANANLDSHSKSGGTTLWILLTEQPAKLGYFNPLLDMCMNAWEDSDQDHMLTCAAQD